MAAGGFAVGWFNDTYTAPALESALPTLQTNHILAKATDTVSTGITSWGAGKFFNAVGLRRVGEAVSGGGYFVTALKALATPIDGAEVKLTTPSPLSLFRASQATNKGQLPGATPVPQLAAGNGPNNTGYANGAATPAATAANSGFQFNTDGTFQSVPAPPSSNLDWGA